MGDGKTSIYKWLIDICCVGHWFYAQPDGDVTDLVA